MYLSHVNCSVSASTSRMTSGNSFVSTVSGSRSSIVNESTIESGGGGGGWSGVGRVVAGAIGGDAWSTSSQKDLQELTSVPTSPTCSPPPQQVCKHVVLSCRSDKQILKVVRISECPNCPSGPLHKEQGEEAEVPEGPHSLPHWLRSQNGRPRVSGRGD